jgi:hypothetical protein
MQQLRAQFIIMDEALRKGCGPKASQGIQLPATDMIPPVSSLTGSSLAGGGLTTSTGKASTDNVSSLLSGILG